MKWISPAGVCGMLIIALSASVMLGLAAYIANPVEMTFNSAACFFLTGIALLFADDRPDLRSPLYTIIGACILLTALLTLLERHLHSGNPFDNTVIGLIPTSICILSLPFMNKHWVAACVQFLLFCISLLGVSGLIGNALNININQLDFITSAVFTLLGCGLLSTWRNSRDFQSFYEQKEDKKILLISLIILFYMGLFSGFLGFIASANQNQAMVAASLQLLLQDKSIWLKNSMQQAYREITAIKNIDSIKTMLANNKPADLSDMDNFLINATFSSIIIANTNNKALYTSGTMSRRPQDAIALSEHNVQSYLFVKDDSLILQSDIPMPAGQNKLGNIQLEWKINSLGMMFAHTDQNHAGQEFYEVCAPSALDKITCAPSGNNSFSNAALLSFSGMNELNRLIRGNSPGILTGTDNLNDNVVITYRPIGFANIGIIVKKDLAVIYSPLKHQLLLILPFLFLVLLISAFILYRQILPLIRDVIQARKSASDMNIRLNAIFNHVDQGIIVSNADGDIEEFNPKSTEIFGYTKDEIIGKNIKYLIPQCVAKGANEVPALHKDGHLVPIELSSTDMLVAGKRSTVGIMRDITDKKLIESRLKESEEKFRSAFNSTAIGMAIISTDGIFIQVNSAFCQILGYTEKELLNVDFQTIIISQDLIGALKKRQDLLDDNIKCFQSEERYHHKNGRTVWLQLTYSLVRSENFAPLYFVVQIQDITEQKKSAEQLAYQAYYDALTGLANRLHLEHCIKSLINNAKRYHNRFAVFFLDLDHFKKINDQYGHQIGDEVLITFAERLLNAVRKTDTVARLGGDEFVIVVTDVTNISVLTGFAEKVVHSLADPIKIGHHEFHLTTSLGISVYPVDGKDCQTLLKSADMALYRAKEKGRNNYQFSSYTLSEPI